MHEAEHSDAASKPRRPLSECVLVFALREHHVLTARDGGPGSMIHVESVQITDPVLQPWLGEHALLVRGREAGGPSEIYGTRGLAVHAEAGAYTSWVKFLAFALARLRSLRRGDLATDDGAEPEVVGILLRFVDAFRWQTLPELADSAQWPIDVVTGLPVQSAESFIRAQNERGVVEFLVRSSREVFRDTSSAENANVALLTLDIQRGAPFDPEAADNKSVSLTVDPEVEAMHSVSKSLFWKAVSPRLRADGVLFSDEERQEFAALESLAAGGQ